MKEEEVSEWGVIHIGTMRRERDMAGWDSHYVDHVRGILVLKDASLSKAGQVLKVVVHSTPKFHPNILCE